MTFEPQFGMLIDFNLGWLLSNSAEPQFNRSELDDCERNNTCWSTFLENHSVL